MVIDLSDETPTETNLRAEFILSLVHSRHSAREVAGAYLLAYGEPRAAIAAYLRHNPTEERKGLDARQQSFTKRTLNRLYDAAVLKERGIN